MSASIRLPTRRIGSLEVPVVGLGCNNFGSRLDEGRTRRVVDAALDVGVTFFDTADIYGRTQSETFLGRILEGRRDRVVLATKFGMQVDRTRGGAAPAYVRRALEDSLRRLRTDRIDLYQLHEPDPSTPIADTLGALEGFADERGHSSLELAFGWLLAHAPVASVIAGATTPEQVRANAAAAGWVLTADETELAG